MNAESSALAFIAALNPKLLGLDLLIGGDGRGPGSPASSSAV
jgi:hypothetical protein